MTDQSLKSTTSVDGIQYLRAIAALMVVAHHARHYFPSVEAWTNFGSRGVDIFFVISGFIMAHSTQAYCADSHRASQAADFLRKRLIRVVPLYWLALLWTGKRQWLAGTWTTDALKDFAFIPHFHPLYTGSIFPLLVPGWTINYEMFFYALFALSLLFGRQRFTVLALVLLTLVALGLNDWSSAPAIFYTSNVLLEFMLGIGVYFWVVNTRCSFNKPWLVAAMGTGFASLAIENSDSIRGLADGPCAALIVGSTVLWSQGLKIDWLRQLGDASYSIYLFHLATFSPSGALLRYAGVVSATPLHVAAAIVLQLVIAAVAGVAIHRMVERPLLSLLKRRFMPTRTLPRYRS